MRLTIILFLIYCFICPVKSYSQKKEQSIRELLVVMHQDSLTNKVLKASITPLLLIEQDLIKREWMRAKFVDAAPRIEEMNRKFVKNEVVPVYDRHFTHREVKGLIRFYTSKVGKKFLSVTPSMTGELMKILMEKYLPEMRSAILSN